MKIRGDERPQGTDLGDEAPLAMMGTEGKGVVTGGQKTAGG